MSVGIADSKGLICAFRLAPREELDPKEPVLEGPLWLHFNLMDARTGHCLDRYVPLDDEARGLLLGHEPRVHLQVYPTSFAAVLGDLQHDFNADPEGFSALRVYVDARVIITCRRHRVRSVDRLRHWLERTDSVESPLELFQQLVQEIVEAFAETVHKLSEGIEDAEDEILAGRFKDHASELGRVRRLLARLRRHVNANRSALLPVPDRIGTWCDAEQRQRLREVIERFDAASQDLDLVTERARLLQEEIAGRLGEATNRNLYLLSIVTTAVLPITLITGIFGMNVPGLPFAASAHGFWAVVLVMAVTLYGTMLFLRKMRAL